MFEYYDNVQVNGIINLLIANYDLQTVHLRINTSFNIE